MTNTLFFLIGEFFPSFLGLIDTFMIDEGVSLLGLLVAIILLSVIIGAILIRV